MREYIKVNFPVLNRAWIPYAIKDATDYLLKVGFTISEIDSLGQRSLEPLLLIEQILILNEVQFMLKHIPEKDTSALVMLQNRLIEQLANMGITFRREIPLEPPIDTKYKQDHFPTILNDWIPFPIENAHDYLSKIGFTESQYIKYEKEHANITLLINQILLLNDAFWFYDHMIGTDHERNKFVIQLQNRLIDELKQSKLPYNKSLVNKAYMNYCQTREAEIKASSDGLSDSEKMERWNELLEGRQQEKNSDTPIKNTKQ